MASLVNDAQTAKLREEEQNIVALAKIVQQKREELRKAETVLEAAEETFEWNRLRVFAEADDEAKTLSNALEDSIVAFEKSLCPPSDFEEGVELYQSTDECGDLSSVESTLDDVLEEISQYRRSDLQNNIERSVAMLLLVSLKFQRLAFGQEGVLALANCTATPKELSTGGASANNNPRNIRLQALDCSEYDEMKQSLLDEWSETLTDLTSLGEDSGLMVRMLSNKLGHPFDDISNGRQ